jgi:hypothetical protein
VQRPADECPYPKPFPVDFVDCPAFQPRQFIPLDTMYQPLEPVLTCRHLQTQALPQRHRWYAACALGDAEARRRWVEELGTVRLERIRSLQASLGAAIAPYTARLWNLKGQQLRAIHDGVDSGPVTAELRALAAEAAADLNRFLTLQASGFAEVDMPIEAARHLIHVAINRFIETQFASEISFEVPDDVLEQFPESVRSFFRPIAPQRSPAGR